MTGDRRVSHLTAERTDGLPKYERVAASVRAQIADGTLKPGQPAPSGAALACVTGYGTLTCRKALAVLIAEGTLVPGPSRNARPRIAGPAASPDKQARAGAARALSAALVRLRAAAGLTQAELAEAAGFSLTAVGHAETGRTWQADLFWAQADKALDAGGKLARLHDAYRAACAALAPKPQPAVPAAVPLPALIAITLVWDDGTVTTVDPAAWSRPP
jgi:DNA-binding transcriptional regulator YhcF (GntR family)